MDQSVLEKIRMLDQRPVRQVFQETDRKVTSPPRPEVRGVPLPLDLPRGTTVKFTDEQLAQRRKPYNFANGRHADYRLPRPLNYRVDCKPK